MKLLLNKKIKITFFLILFGLSLISVVHSFNQAQLYSYDLHLSPAKLVSEGVNHYQYVLEGKNDGGPEDKLLYSQHGIYSHGIFILLIPFTWISWDNAKLLWAFFNIIFTFLILLLLLKKFNLSKNLIILSACLFLMSTPFRINIGYGQQTLFTFLFFILPFVFKNKFSIFLSGLSYFKYNIGYVLFLYFVSLKNIKTVIISTIPFVAGWLTYSYMTNSQLIRNLFEPILILQYFFSQENKLPVTIFSLLEHFGIHSSLRLFLPLLLSFFVIFKLKFIKDDLYKLSIICLTSLSFTAHQLHDYILLLPLLIFSLKNFHYLVCKINFLIIFYFFFFLRVLSYFFGFQPWDFPYGYFGYLNNFLIVSILLINFNYFKNKIK